MVQEQGQPSAFQSLAKKLGQIDESESHQGGGEGSLSGRWVTLRNFSIYSRERENNKLFPVYIFPKTQKEELSRAPDYARTFVLTEDY